MVPTWILSHSLDSSHTFRRGEHLRFSCGAPSSELQRQTTSTGVTGPTTLTSGVTLGAEASLNMTMDTFLSRWDTTTQGRATSGV